LTSELVENRNIFKPVTIEAIVIFMVKRRMGNGEWENDSFLHYIFVMWNKFFSAAISDIHVLFFATFYARIKGCDNGRSRPACLYFTS